MELTLKSTCVRLMQLKILGKAVKPDDLLVYVTEVHTTVEPNDVTAVGRIVLGETDGEMEGIAVVGEVDGVLVRLLLGSEEGLNDG